MTGLPTLFRSRTPFDLHFVLVSLGNLYCWSTGPDPPSGRPAIGRDCYRPDGHVLCRSGACPISVAGEGSLELGGGQAAEAALASPAVVGVLDPVDDRVVQVLATASCLRVHDVALEQCPEALHGGVAPSRRDATHRALKSCDPQVGPEAPCTELGSSVGVDHDDAVGLASCDRRTEGVHGQVGRHPLPDPLADDAVGALAYLHILASHADKQRDLVRLAAESLPSARIAEELGYANANVVKATLHRTYRKIREQFYLRYSDYFG